MRLSTLLLVAATLLLLTSVTMLVYDHYNHPERLYSLAPPTEIDYPVGEEVAFPITLENKSSRPIGIVGLTWC